ncbi:DNA methyltransferase [Xanthomonas prunicola]|uniref:McrB family protein n=1 Tax=Xanthomonas prunicola TaxID=2053930 RepID=UPI0021B1FFD5|nr:DNA methyltransferase [Xanthomonas prunicola]UXA57892.1 DNA methyltransferase [Xanthomonas prunicola]
MPQFLTAQRIKSSIDAVADTRGKAALLDFLIIKRTLAIKAQPSVAIVQGEAAYIQATAELAGVFDKPKINIKAQKEIFNVFSSQDAKQGFRNGKYISNGTGTTISGNPWQTVIELSTDDPRKASLRAGHEVHLADLLLTSAKAAKPRLGDVAVFHYRRTNIDAILGGEADPAKRFDLLEKRIAGDYALSSTEIAELFETGGGSIEDADLQTAAAAPEEYLDGLAPPTTATATAVTGKLCSFDLVTALAAKPFVILTGTSGTGKSRSTLRLAESLQELYAGQVDGQIFQLVSIGPDWTSPKKLLGFRTPFGQARRRDDGTETNESYEITESLRIILRACHPNSTKIPHFLVFDEMNLSHVERYFAPFLSLMEASSILEDGENAPIIDRQSLAVISELLNDENKDSTEAQSAQLLVTNGQPLKLPPNLFYVGTVNIDETTHMFSPKVLDRAHVLEVKALTPSQYVAGSGEKATIDLSVADDLLRQAIDDREADEAAGSNPAAILDLLASKHGVAAAELVSVKELTLKTLDGCFKLLGPVGFEFGFRVVKEVYGYMYVWTKAQLATGKPPAAVMADWINGLDRAIFQKVLPKIHGNRSALGDSLKALAAFLDGAHGKSGTPARYLLGTETTVEIAPGEALTFPADSQFRQCRDKLLAMHARLISRNHVSFVK